MPKLTDEERALVAESGRLYNVAFDSARPKYISLHCRVCNWASNGLSFDEALVTNQRHEYAAHPGLKKWDDFARTHGGVFLDSKALHDHDCPETFCSCKCGCQVGPYCGIVEGALCDTCSIGAGRGDSTHGEGLCG